MEVLTGPYTAAIGLLLVAGALKVAHPGAARPVLDAAGLGVLARRPLIVLGGLAEVAAALTALLLPGRTGPALITAAYVLLAAFSFRAMRRGARSCGCFGDAERPSPPGWLHIGLDLAFAGLAAAVAATTPAEPLFEQIAAQPLAGLPLLACAVLCGWLAYLALTELPATLAAARDEPQPPARRAVPLPDPVVREGTR
jgi:hypothetical protein